MHQFNGAGCRLDLIIGEPQGAAGGEHQRRTDALAAIQNAVAHRLMQPFRDLLGAREPAGQRLLHAGLPLGQLLTKGGEIAALLRRQSKSPSILRSGRLMASTEIMTSVAGAATPSRFSARSGAIGPDTRGPRSEVSSALRGCRNASLTAVPSKPQWAMQLLHLGLLPMPYLCHSVSSIRDL